MFPFTITYRRALDQRFDEIDTRSILNAFRENLKRKGVDKINSETDSLMTFKIHFFSSKPGANWNLWVGINRGKIEVEESTGKRMIIYEFNTAMILIIGFIAGLFFWIVSQMWWAGCFGFLILGLFNWITTLVRHDDNLTGVLNEVLKKQKTRQV